MFAIGFDNLTATIQHVLDYIPGFGIVSESSSENIMEVMVMKEPTFIEIKGEKVEINSSWVSINKDQVIVTAILRYPKSIKLDGELVIEYNGEKINRDGEMDDFSTPNDEKSYKEMYYTYTIRNPKPPIYALIFKTEESKVEIPYEKSEDLKNRIISQNFNGIIVSAIPLNEKRSQFILTSTYEKKIEGVKFISSLGMYDNNQIKAIDEYGNEYELKKSTSQGNEYYVSGDIKGKIIALKFSKLYQSFMYENNKGIKGIRFKIPKVSEKININKSLNNKLCEINLKTVERVESNDKSPFNLMFTYQMKSKIPNLSVSNIGLYLDKNGGATAGKVLEKSKEEDSFIVKYGVYSQENIETNTVNISPYHGSYYHNTLLLDKECILKFE